MRSNIKINIATASPIQSGLSIHIHPQLITWHNLRTIKATVKRPVNPMPDDDELDFDMIFCFYFKKEFSILVCTVSSLLALHIVPPIGGICSR